MTLVVVCYFFMLGIVISSRDLVCFALLCFALLDFAALATFNHDSPTKVLMSEQVQAS